METMLFSHLSEIAFQSGLAMDGCKEQFAMLT